MVGLISATGLVGFLSEPEPELKVFALKALDAQVDVLWTEIAGAVGQIEALSEDDTFPERELASLLASKVYYHLQEYNESMVFALGAGSRFDLESGGEFEETIISKCVDTFISINSMPKSSHQERVSDQTSQINAFRTGGATSTSAGLTSPITPFSQSALPSKSLLSRPDSTIEPGYPSGEELSKASSDTPLILRRGMQNHLKHIIDRIFERCFQEQRYRQVVGIAVEAKDSAMLRTAILRAAADDKNEGADSSKRGEELMEYVLGICMNIVQERAFRNEILKMVLDLLNEIPAPDYFSIAKCVVYLNEHSMASEILQQLVEKGDARSLAVAYQISFDLYDNSTQEFLKKVRQEVSAIVKESGPTESSEKMEDDQTETKETDNLLQKDENAGNSKFSDETRSALSSILEILEGVHSIQLNLEFLYKCNKADVAILNKIRDHLEARNSIFHTAVTVSTAFMHAGTTYDKFFRDNLDWLGKAVNWSKFTATAGLGVIHRGNLSQGQKLLAPYLPKDTVAGVGSAGSVYSQGGSLYALGLIYANHGGPAVDLIREHFVKATDDVVQHGGALGLGVAAMATGDEGMYAQLKEVLNTDSAVSGEAVGLSMGLIMLGTGNMAALEDMVQYAHLTQHEKIIRGLAVGMALIMYGRQEAADELVSGLLGDPDPTLRYGGILAIAMAYCGTGSNKAVRKLLHVAVSDVNDDVRRAAVMNLGFILFRKYQSVPRMVELLAESYNPHVRYGAAMALGISCAGTGLENAIDLLEPMLKDSVDFVRQGAFIALSMVLVQQNEVRSPKIAEIRKMMLKVVSDRHEDAMAKFGCALALGIIDAGGRNCTISLQTQTGNLNMPGIVGMAIFTQYWYWFPLTHFLSLSFTPTAVIGVDHKLDVPLFKFHSNTRPSLFDYPPEQQEKADEEPEKVKTAVLSTTAQAKRRAQRREKQQRRESIDVEQTPTTPKSTQLPEKMDIDEKPEEEKPVEQGPAAPKRKLDKETEKVGYDIRNMSRVLPAQLKFLSFPNSRYEPVKKPTGGVMVLLDNKPDEPREIIDLVACKESKPSTTPSEPDSLQERINAALHAQAEARARGPIRQSGAALAAGVLTAVDEDEEGAEEAPVPDDFTYESDGE
ncbi:proteasome regulatory particle base subunit [Myotisia sp. PD_48]|nr:proteasome regulatory particle base subunit [Myotisia sp. PD_48]